MIRRMAGPHDAPGQGYELVDVASGDVYGRIAMDGDGEWVVASPHTEDDLHATPDAAMAEVERANGICPDLLWRPAGAHPDS